MTKWARIALVAGLAVWTIDFARTPIADDAMESFLHLPDLVFHEAGHVIFSPFGRFMTVFGGSLLQVLIPVIAAIAFVRQEEPFSTAVCAWWAGQNLVDLAPYIADARSLRLTLIGGRTGAEVEGHDWEFLLNQLGVSHHAHPIGYTTHAVGIIIMVAALIYAGRTIARGSE
ncbi:MAG TPA: hypothetical protein VNT81_20760 [Vicinamibacterales bacterium]|nr:hypothetical protein [Vicinamibacterales bacterium]